MVKTTAFILDDRARALAHYPHARQVGELLFVSGVSSRRADNSFVGAVVEEGRIKMDIRAQTEAVLENVRVILEAAGAGLEHVVDVTTFLVSMEDFSGYNEVYNRYFNAQSGPTRTTVAVHQLPHPQIAIEMKIIARVP
ncbi:MAG: RidA family protein [Bradymonadaceae bacterium]